MNINKFFELAKERGIDQSQLQIGRSTSLKIGVFHHEIEDYRLSSSQNVIACGIYKGKFGSARTEKFDKDTFDYLIDQIILSASYSEKEEDVDIFKGSDKYVKAKVFSKALAECPVEKKIETLKGLENSIYAYDERIAEVQVQYSEVESSSEFYNSFGLKLKQKRNFAYFAASVYARSGEENKSAWNFEFTTDIATFDPKKFTNKVCEDVTKKFGGEPCDSKKCPVILHKGVAADLIAEFLVSAIADEVQRHSSMLEGKLGQKVASSKVTIEEKPLTKNIHFNSFDDEGVASKNKTIVKKGILQQYFYNRETAKKDGVESTGNGFWSGGKIGTSFGNVFVKGGKKSLAEMMSQIKDGVFITEVAGLGTGLNTSSGDFSCQAEGYDIHDGKIAEPLNLITLSGNLLKLLSDIKEFDNEVEMTLSEISVGDAYVKSLSIGGK